MEVDLNKGPAEGEVMVFTIGGGFIVKGSMAEVAETLAAEDWPQFELAQSDDPIIIRSSQVVALRAGARSRKGSMGFLHNS